MYIPTHSSSNPCPLPGKRVSLHTAYLQEKHNIEMFKFPTKIRSLYNLTLGRKEEGCRRGKPLTVCQRVPMGWQAQGQKVLTWVSEGPNKIIPMKTLLYVEEIPDQIKRDHLLPISFSSGRSFLKILSDKQAKKSPREKISVNSFQSSPFYVPL